MERRWGELMSGWFCLTVKAQMYSKCVYLYARKSHFCVSLITSMCWVKISLDNEVGPRNEVGPTAPDSSVVNPFERVEMGALLVTSVPIKNSRSLLLLHELGRWLNSGRSPTAAHCPADRQPLG